MSDSDFDFGDISGGVIDDSYSSMEVHLDQFDGPLDLLLDLARRQKVDLLEISIVSLVDQYLLFIDELRSMRISVAADYLLMASSLAHLKSRLLLPSGLVDDLEESAELQAERLAFRLRYLSKVRELSDRLWGCARFGEAFFGVGMSGVILVERHNEYSDSLYDLLSCYGFFRMRDVGGSLSILATDLYSADDLYCGLRDRVVGCEDWVEIGNLLPEFGSDMLRLRSAVAGTLAVGLELARQGCAELRQSDNFAPIYVRGVVGGDDV